MDVIFRSLLKIKPVHFQRNNVKCTYSIRNALSCTARCTITTRSVSTSTSYRPRRSLLFVPADDAKKINKASKLKADCIILECEDGVAMSKKDIARKNINDMLGCIDFEYGECAVRVNSVDSGLVLDDLQAVLSGRVLPEAILLPKVENEEQIKWFADQVKIALGRRTQSPHDKMAFIFFIETPIGLLNARSIMEATIGNHLPFQTEAGVFGSDDFLANLGGARTEDAKELLFARQYFVTHCKAFSLQAIDMVHINFKDLDSLKRQAEEAAKMGFTGKQLIHPGQIETVNSAFMPSTDKIEWAQELVKEFEKHEISGKGAFTFRGSMIDLPLLKQAKNILRIVTSVEKMNVK